MQKLKDRVFTTRLGFLSVLLLLIWLKTLFAYYIDFNLGVENPLQHLLLILNPLGTTVVLLSVALYVRHPRRAYLTAYLVYVLFTVLLVANVLYYREFTNFMTVTIVLGVSKVAQGLGASTMNMLTVRDFIYVFDVLAVVATYLGYAGVNFLRRRRGAAPSWPHLGFTLDCRPVPFHLPQAVTMIGVVCFGITMAGGELNRPQLLTRTFDSSYIVRYLGLVPFTVYDGFKTAQNTQVRATADAGDMDKVLAYTKAHYAAPNVEYAGQAKGKNVIIIHLESFQQFLIGMQVQGQEVTPFLNSLVKQPDTLSFDNVFHQVGLGKTSDAENMLETSTFGIANGSLFSSLGTDNTFEGAPAILNQTKAYTTAVFHGGAGSFWNRNNVYKNLGYQYFFDGGFYSQNAGTTEYGIKDKLMFGETVKYMEHLQQPFYGKIITTSNHYPFYLSDQDGDFPDANTSDVYVNGYFRTAHYLDQALREFFAYLKASGLDKESLVMLYGDHFGISDDRNLALAPLLGKDPATWSGFDNASLQRIPLIFTMPGLKGGIKHTYGGEIDVLPTLMHLLGVDAKPYVQFGSDLLSPQHDQTVALRNHNFITPRYTVLGPKVYQNTTGELITPNTKLQTRLKADQQAVNTALRLSDSLATKNLLRYYVPSGFTPVTTSSVDYAASLKNMLQVERNLGPKSTSLFSQKNGVSTTTLYNTDAAEVQTNKALLTDFPEAVSDANAASTSSQPAP